MKCEECREQVFELIERESVDPEGVRAILAECPECREEFDALKASLAFAGQLPLEEPPAGMDAAILSQAARGLGNVVPLRKRLFQTPPWAMAAVALLAVGVGVWSIPREVQLESDVVPAAPAVEEVEAVAFGDAEAAPHAELVARRDERAAAQVAEAPRGKEQNAAKGSGRPARKQAARTKKRREAPVAQRPARSFDEDDLALEGAGAPPAAEPKKAEARERAVALGSAADSAESAQDQSRCKTQVAAFERRLRAERRFEPAPEEQLAIGRCYQALGDEKKARTWLERAAAHPATKDRATKALKSVSAD